MFDPVFIAPAVLGATLLGGVSLSVLYRNVVATNMVDIVQSRKKTTSYGKGHASNVYWKWPEWVPLLGVTMLSLPVSNFELSLSAYAAYDQDKVPFLVDVTAFFVISDTNIAAQRVKDMDELKSQILKIVQGAVRKVLADDSINAIMLERSKFGKQFTEEVSGQLAEWGVSSVKSMELMDIRDSADSNVIENIMAMKKSYIERESRTEVAENMKAASIAEIDAQRKVDVQKQDALQIVGERTAQKNMAVGVADENSKQSILESQKETAEKDMAVKKVNDVRSAEIKKEEQIVAASQQKETDILIAEGKMEAQKRDAEAIVAVGEAKAKAETAIQLAPVEAQITLAKEIGENQAFQEYLVSLESIASYLKVGMEQAKALTQADVKVISNVGNPNEGLGGVMNMFSSSGGTQVAAAIEALAQSELGQTALSKIGATKTVESSPVKRVSGVTPASKANPKTNQTKK